MEQKERQENGQKLAANLFGKQNKEEAKKEEAPKIEKASPAEETLDPNKGLHSAMKGAENSQEELEVPTQEKEAKESPQESSVEQKQVMELLSSLMEEQAKHGKILEENAYSMKKLEELLKNLDKTLNVEENAEVVYNIVKRTQSLLEKHQESLESIDMRFTEGMDMSFQSMKVNFTEYIKCIHEAHQKIVTFSKATDGFLEKEREVVMEEKEEENPSGVSFNVRGKGFIPFGVLLFLIVLVGIYFLKK